MLVEAVASVAAVVVGIPVAYLVWEYLHRRVRLFPFAPHDQ